MRRATRRRRCTPTHPTSRSPKPSTPPPTGSSPKTVGTTAGEVELRIPGDRTGTSTPRLVPTGSRRLSQLDEMIVSLYAGGMTVRDIEHHLVSTLGVDL